ncbi:terpene synthase [Lentzea flava]|uniref:Terpene synthase n=1 Tax=Lentzea flava TaxID=103732 RepID=A0ABQ2VIG6_9PSEU|nr:terpene synthase [Lentzea flava]MCP2205565.1 hypothetical protein [Lentzea flava]GGU88011.1 hypothetical protein GCM10010178_92100 [Lentzea flava]
MTTAPFDDLPSPAQCAPITVLALRLLADLRQWTAAFALRDTPVEAMAMTAATISPWRSADELRLATRMYAWTYALDDEVEREVTDQANLDALLGCCAEIVRTGRYDGTHPLLAALAAWQREVNDLSVHPRLSDLWVGKVDLALRGVRYDWVTGRDRSGGQAVGTDVREYLSHADSILVWMANFGRWVTLPAPELLGELDTLVSAMDDLVVAVRLANDVATYSWERVEGGQNNVLMYDVTPDWVLREMHTAADSARRRLAGLVAGGCAPAVEIVRQLDCALSFYALADFRGWGSDMPVGSGTGNRQADGGNH